LPIKNRLNRPDRSPNRTVFAPFVRFKTKVLIEMLSEASVPADGADHDSTRAYAFEERRRAIKSELKSLARYRKNL